MGADGTVQARQKISRTTGGFTGALCCGQVRMGKSVARVGDLDGDGRDELAVSTDTEQIFLLYLNANGTVSSNPSIPRPSGSTNGFGGALAGPGDLDLDGVPDLLVGADRYYRTSALFTLFLASDGSVLSTTKVSWSAGGFAGVTPESAPLANALAALGDLDGDGELDFAMGTCRPQAYCFTPIPPFFSCFDKPGSAWIAGIRSDGTVGEEKRVTDGSGGIGPLDPNDGFGSAVTRLGDLDGNGLADLAIGAPFDDGPGSDQGSVWIAFLEPAPAHGPALRRAPGALGTRTTSAPPSTLLKLSNESGGIPTPLHAHSYAGSAVAAIGDLDDDGNQDLALGTPGMDNGTTLEAGGFRILFLDEHGTVGSESLVTATQFATAFDFGRFAWSLAALGDHDGDGVEDLAVACPEANFVWIALMNIDGSLASSVRISDALPEPFLGNIYNSYGSGLADIGDIDGDGVDDLALLDAGGLEFENSNVLFVVFLNANGTVKSFVQHAFGTGGTYYRPISCASIGDLNGNGRNEVAVGESAEDLVRVFFLNANGTIQVQRQIPGLSSTKFGAALAGAGDLDADGIEDLVVGAPETAGFRGAYWILHLNANGTLKSSVQFQGPRGQAGYLDAGDEFGTALAFLGDHDGDNVPSLVIGARGDDDLNTDSGAAWIVDLP